MTRLALPLKLGPADRREGYTITPVLWKEEEVARLTVFPGNRSTYTLVQGELRSEEGWEEIGRDTADPAHPDHTVQKVKRRMLHTLANELSARVHAKWDAEEQAAKQWQADHTQRIVVWQVMRRAGSWGWQIGRFKTRDAARRIADALQAAVGDGDDVEDRRDTKVVYEIEETQHYLFDTTKDEALAQGFTLDR